MPRHGSSPNAPAGSIVALARGATPETFGRYLVFPAIARGGMATVHVARPVASEGVTRLVAVKRLHSHLLGDPEFVAMFRDEASIAARVDHPNVVPLLDVVATSSELVLVQEYVHGVPLSHLLKAAHFDGAPVPVAIVVALLTGVLAGLHAAHEATDELGRPLDIVHRDVSPQNVIVGVDGVPRLLDFGIAKARTSTHHTRDGVFKGKLAYIAPEQLCTEPIDRRADLYSIGVLAWEMLVNARITEGRHEIAFLAAMMCGEIPSVVAALAKRRAGIGERRWSDLRALDRVVSRAMSRDAAERPATADELRRALLEARAGASAKAVGQWVRAAGRDFLDERERVLVANEESFRRMCLQAPSSGTQRTVGSTIARWSSPPGRERGPASAPRSERVIEGPWPKPVRTGNDLAHAASAHGASCDAPGASSLGSLAASARSSPLVAAVVAIALVLVGLVAGLLHGAAAASARAAAEAPPSPTVFVMQATTAPASPPPELAVGIAPTKVLGVEAAPPPATGPSPARSPVAVPPHAAAPLRAAAPSRAASPSRGARPPASPRR
jgi:eukaryotic-like serine/threonine-protein kinase